MANEDVVVFVGILVFIALIAVGVFEAHLPVPLVLAAFLVLFALFLVHPNIVEVREYERAVVFRLGKFYNIKGPGWVPYFSTIDTFTIVDMRTKILDVQPQEVITQDNIKIQIDAVIYYRVVDARKSVVEVKDVDGAVEHLIKAQLRNVIGKLLLEEVLEKTEEINQELFNVVKDVEDKWGISTSRVEISSIELPPDLLKAFMRRREASEYKEKLETEARAKQVAIEILDSSLRNMSDKTVAYLYLDVLKRIADGKSNKIIFPLELTRLATVIAEKSGWAKKEEPSGFDEIARSLVEAYRTQQKETLDKKIPSEPISPEPQKPEESKAGGKKKK